MLLCEKVDVKMPNFQERFHRLRIEKNVSVQEVAEYLEMSQPNLSRIVNGQSRLRVDVLEKIAGYFDVDVEYLRGESTVRKKPKQLPDDYIQVIIKAMNKNVSIEQLDKFLEIFPDREDKKE